MRSTLSMFCLVLWAAIDTNSLHKPTTCHVYKIQYNGPKDSVRTLMEIQYFNEKMDIVKDIEKSRNGDLDTRETKIEYDEHGNKIKELVTCSGRDTTSSIKWGFKYSRSGKLASEWMVQQKPFYQGFVKLYSKDSIIEYAYDNEDQMPANNPASKFVDVLNKSGKVILSYTVHQDHDTSNVRVYGYRPLEDTNKLFMPAPLTIKVPSTKVETQITYYNSSGKEQRIDNLQNDVVEERESIEYDKANRVVGKQEFSLPTNTVITGTTYHYDSQGLLDFRQENDFKSQLTENYFYKQSKLIRKEYIFNGVLDHAIIYVYK